MGLATPGCVRAGGLREATENAGPVGARGARGASNNRHWRGHDASIHRSSKGKRREHSGGLSGPLGGSPREGSGANGELKENVGEKEREEPNEERRRFP